jgi:hypothetical protein
VQLWDGFLSESLLVWDTDLLQLCQVDVMELIDQNHLGVRDGLNNKHLGLILEGHALVVFLSCLLDDFVSDDLHLSPDGHGLLFEHLHLLLL